MGGSLGCGGGSGRPTALPLIAAAVSGLLRLAPLPREAAVVAIESSGSLLWAWDPKGCPRSPLE